MSVLEQLRKVKGELHLVWATILDERGGLDPTVMQLASAAIEVQKAIEIEEKKQQAAINYLETLKNRDLPDGMIVDEYKE